MQGGPDTTAQRIRTPADGFHPGQTTHPASAASAGTGSLPLSLAPLHPL